jgi:hypothetical protein
MRFIGSDNKGELGDGKTNEKFFSFSVQEPVFNEDG